MIKGKVGLPPLKSYGKNKNAESQADIQAEPRSFTELSWAAKEKVLRVLFAKMNGTSLSKAAEKAEKIRDQMHELRRTARDNREQSGFSKPSSLPDNIAPGSDDDQEFDSQVVTDTLSERELPVTETHTEDFTTTIESQSEGISAI